MPLRGYRTLTIPHDTVPLHTAWTKLYRTAPYPSRPQVYRVLFPAICDKNDEQQRRARGSCSLMGLDPELFYDLFPFRERSFSLLVS